MANTSSDYRVVFPSGTRLSELALSGSLGGSASGVAGTGTANYIAKWTDTTAIGDTNITENTSAVVFNSRIVRITGIPDSAAGMLHIRPNSGNKGYITFTENGVSDNGAIGFDNGNTNFNIITGGVVGTGTLQFTIQTSGNVGLRVSSPTAHLDVAGVGTDGTAAFKGTTYRSHFCYNGDGSEDTYIRGGKAGAKVIINDQSTGNVNLTGGGDVAIGSTASTYIRSNSGDFEWHVTSGKAIKIIVG